MIASITIVYIVFAVIGALSITYFQYFYKLKTTKANFVLAVLRFLEVFVLLLLLINPQIKTNQLEYVKPVLNVLVDNSRSILFAKQSNNVDKILQGVKSNSEIKKKFEIHYFAFSDDLYRQDTFSFKQPETNILKTLKAVNSITKGIVAPSILITDGNQTYGASYAYYKSNQAIYPILVGDTLTYDDVRIHQVNVNSYANLKHNFPVEVFLQYNGKKDLQKRFTVKLNNTIVYSKNISFKVGESAQHLTFYLPASSIGKHHYQCKIETLTNEKNTLNNVTNFSIEVIDEQAKILILTDMNHPDIGMLKRSIETNEQRKVIIDKDLNSNIQLKDYQLIIVYQPNYKFKKIFNNLKLSSSNFLIVTGTKTDWNFLNKAQSYFNKENIPNIENYSATYNLDFDEFIMEDIGFVNFPPLQDHFGNVKFSVAHKNVLNQTVSGYSTENPLLTTFTDSGRRGAVLFGENSWKWRMLDKVAHQSFDKFDTFIAKLIQYLASNKRTSRLKIEYQPFVYANRDVLISAQFFDANYVFDENASLILTVKNGISKLQKEYPFSLRKNTYEVVLNNLKPATYSFTVSAISHKLSKSGKFAVLPYSIEQQLSTANSGDLKKVASTSNGAFFYMNETQRLLKELLLDKRYQIIQKSKEKIVSLFEFKWLLGLLILLFSLEWFIRKYKGFI